MLLFKDVKEVIEIISKFENPVIVTVVLVLACFILWRKFTTSEYVTAGKETLNSLINLYNTLYKAHEDLKIEYNELKKEFDGLKYELIECKKIINNFINNENSKN